MYKKIMSLLFCMTFMIITVFAINSFQTNVPIDEKAKQAAEADLAIQHAKNITSRKDDYIIGMDREQAVKQTVIQIFNLNLDSFLYSPAGLLHNGNPNLNKTETNLISIMADNMVGSKVGDHQPYGVLYQGDQAFILMERKDGNIYLEEYQLSSTATTGNPISDFSEYNLINTNVKPADQNLLQKILYY